MFVRFVGAQIDRDSGRREGIFQLSARLERSNHILTFDGERLKELTIWFDANLKKPARFARSQSGRPAAVAISWFKDSARVHLTKIREMQLILETYDLPIEMIKTDRPGYIVYEDEYQVTALPFNDTAT